VPRRGRSRARLSDAHRILAVQALRAAVYGLGSVLIGVTLERRGLSGGEVGLVLGGFLAGTALASIVLARYGDRIGRRRAYRLLLVGMGLAGTAFALTDFLPLLVLAALTGTVSTEVIESGPFTSLEQAMLPQASEGNATRLFGTYNAVAALAGSLGALAAIAADSAHWLLLYPVAAALGLAVAARLSPALERTDLPDPLPPLHRSRTIVTRLAALFAVDSFGGGFVVQTFVAYLFARKFGASPHTLGVVFFAVGVLQAASFQVAVRIAGRIGLLRTMVFTHLPSNVLLAAIAFAPRLGVAIALLLGNAALSKMDVPTRQAYVMALVDPTERVAAAAYTNTARYATRPLAPLVAGPAAQLAFGAPFLVAGVLKTLYDLGLYAVFRRVRLPDEAG
jgi:MFS family permease